MLGERIRTRRKELGWSQQELAKISGIAQSSISRYEKGDVDITLAYILKFAEVLNCSPAYLVAEELMLNTPKKATEITDNELAAVRKHAKEILAIIGE